MKNSPHWSVQGLTGLEDLEVCRALLESQDWDLEAVAREHLGIGEQGEEEPAVREEPPPGPAPLGAGGGAVWRPQGTAGWLLYILSLPARSAISALCRRPLLKQTLRGLGPYKGK